MANRLLNLWSARRNFVDPARDIVSEQARAAVNGTAISNGACQPRRHNDSTGTAAEVWLTLEVCHSEALLTADGGITLAVSSQVEL